MLPSLKSVKLRPGVCCYVGLFSLEDLQLCHKILSEHMAHTAGPQSESGHTWSAIAAWKRCQPRGGMCPRPSRLSVDNSVAPCPWAPISTSITMLKNMFCGWQVINQESIDEQIWGWVYVQPRESKGELWTLSEHSKNNLQELISHFLGKAKRQWVAMKDYVDISVHKWQ